LKQSGSFLSIRNALALRDEGSFQPQHWLASQRRLPKALPFFLKPAFVQAALLFCDISPRFRPAFLQTAAAMAKNPALRRLAWHCHEVLFLAPESPEHPGPWTGLTQALGSRAPLFPAVVLLSGLPQLRRRYGDLGLPEFVLRDTLSDIDIWLEHHQMTSGKPGLTTLPWLMHHFKAQLFRLGRLQFMVKKFDGKVLWLKEATSGRTALMSLAGIRYRRDGQCDGSNHTYEDPKKAWVSSFQQSRGFFQGHLISAGAAQRKAQRLARPAWQVLLKPGDPVLDIHIPAGEPMELSACKASLLEADSFFRRYFPAQKLKGKVCWSWLLDPSFQKMLPPRSNIRAFQSLFHIYPVPCSDGEIFHRVFAPAPFDPARLPRDNSLRRAILDYLGRGGDLLGAGGAMIKTPLELKDQAAC
jgi:hypothetical protein